MGSMRGRAWRRHQLERMKRYVQHIYGGYAKGHPDTIGRLANTRVPCSSYCCGNPRKHFGEVTKQEKIALLNERDMAA